ncbi:hypothetical protein BJ138DRAFT_1165648 [Hygrophoropsis aurantiaca]|uniref:Uncharacterized protein n=1 Tax=Hygrophoropsis aurantiaca TaxID=72124 RepID=A0ACB7ZW98_9AGAM|nr:hypothetical protein BJ138DRAFT_1165648 [Hygrophoropsis aurantiaca]
MQIRIRSLTFPQPMLRLAYHSHKISPLLRPLIPPRLPMPMRVCSHHVSEKSGGSGVAYPISLDVRRIGNSMNCTSYKTRVMRHRNRRVMQRQHRHWIHWQAMRRQHRQDQSLNTLIKYKVGGQICYAFVGELSARIVEFVGINSRRRDVYGNIGILLNFTMRMRGLNVPQYTNIIVD